MYLDNAATMPLSNSMKEYIFSVIDDFGNPSSIYSIGETARNIIENSRDSVSKFINAESDNIYFTSGGSASNTLAIKGYYEKNNCSILYSPTCHKSILECVKHLKRSYPLKVDNAGNIDFDDLKEWLKSRSDDFLVVFEYANSEIGTIQDIERLINLIHFYNAKVYIDCTGSISQIPLDVEKLNIDMAGFSGHKLGALKGCGVLYKKSNIELEPLIYGSQENGYIGGTENVIGIASIGKAVQDYDYSNISSDNRDYVYNFIIENISGSYIVGNSTSRLPLNLYICIPKIEGESLVRILDKAENIQISTGSACTSKEMLPSPSLLAINLNNQDIHSCIRITFSGNESKCELDKLCELLKKHVMMLRNLGSEM